MKVGEISVVLKAITSDFEKDLGKAAASLKKLGAEMKQLGTQSLAIGIGVAAAGYKLVEMAAEADVTAKRFRIAFGAIAGDAESGVRKISKSTGRAVDDLEAFAASFEQILAPMLGGKEAAEQMSLSLTNLAVDMASFAGGTDQEAFEALHGAILGNAKGIKQYGVEMNSAELDQFALDKGIRQTVASMSEAQQTTLRYQFIVSKLSGVQGDATRNTGEWGNRLKNLKGHLQDVAQELGERLMPFAETVVDRFESLISAFDRLSPATKNAVLKIGAVVGALGLLGGAMIPLGMIASALAPLVTFVAGIIGPLLLVVGALAGIVAGVGAMRTAWEKDFLGIRTTIEKVEEAIDKVITKTDKAIQKMGDWIRNKFPHLFLPAGAMSDDELRRQGFKIDNGSAPNDTLGGNLAQTGAAAAGLAGDIKDAVLPAIKDGLAGVMDGLKSSFMKGLETITDLIPEDKKAAFLEWLDKVKQQFEALSGSIDKIGSRGGDTQGGTGLTEAVIPGKTFGQRVSADALDAARGAGAVLGSSMNQGAVGSVIQGGVQGAEVGGPAGAIGGAFLALISQSKGFADMMAKLNQVVLEVANLFSQVFEPLLPLIGTLGLVIRIALVPVVLVLAAQSRLLAFAFHQLFDVVKSTALAFLEMIHKVLKKLHLKVGEVDAAIDELKNTTWDTIGAISGFSDALGTAASEIANAPEGFKAAAYEFEATIARMGKGIGGLLGGGGSRGNAPSGSSASGSATVDHTTQSYSTNNGGVSFHNSPITVVANDPAELFRKLKRIGQRDAHRTSGTISAPLTPFANPR